MHFTIKNSQFFMSFFVVIICSIIYYDKVAYADVVNTVTDYADYKNGLFISVQKDLPADVKDYYKGVESHSLVKLSLDGKIIEVPGIDKYVFQSFWVPKAKSVIALTFTDIYSIDVEHGAKITKLLHEEVMRSPYAISKDHEVTALTVFRPDSHGYEVLLLNTVTDQKTYIKIKESPSFISIEDNALWVGQGGHIIKCKIAPKMQDTKLVVQELPKGDVLCVWNDSPVLFDANNIFVASSKFDLASLKITPVKVWPLDKALLILGKTTAGNFRLITLTHDGSTKIIEDNIELPNSNRAFGQTAHEVWLLNKDRKLICIRNDGDIQKINVPF